jgi:hypothetical protein
MHCPQGPGARLVTSVFTLLLFACLGCTSNFVRPASRQLHVTMSAGILQAFLESRSRQRLQERNELSPFKLLCVSYRGLDGKGPHDFQVDFVTDHWFDIWSRTNFEARFRTCARTRQSKCGILSLVAVLRYVVEFDFAIDLTGYCPVARRFLSGLSLRAADRRHAQAFRETNFASPARL